LNNRDRMYQTNYKIKRELEKLGYREFFLFPHTRFSKDVWGLWDGVVKKYKESSAIFNVYWIQLKTGYASKEDREKMKNFCFLSGQKALLCEYVPCTEVRKNGHKLRVTEF
jgi:hypothetical protein